MSALVNASSLNDESETNLLLLLLSTNFYPPLGKSLCQEHIMNDSLVAAAFKGSALCKAQVFTHT
jgi:hypothetical protein